MHEATVLHCGNHLLMGSNSFKEIVERALSLNFSETKFLCVSVDLLP